MKNNYLLIGGEKVRVEMNWNAMMSFCDQKGIDDLSKIGDIGKLTTRDLLMIMHSAIKEGERMDGKNFEKTKEQLGEVLRPSDISQFMSIYKEQCGVDDGGDDGGGEGTKKKKRFLRLISKG